MSDNEAPQYICLNFCVQDPDTGVCLTCGRPPQPVVWPGMEHLIDRLAPAMPDAEPPAADTVDTSETSPKSAEPA